MSDMKPLLIEVGVEEIPAGIAPHMGQELFLKIEYLLGNGNFAPENLKLGVTPRRLLVHASACHEKQHDYREEIWGPPEKIAYDEDGNPTKAAEGFARKSGLTVDDFTLEDKGDGKGLYMKAVVDKKGLKVIDVLAEAMPDILRKLPSPKQMKWNDGEHREDAFIRPIRWIVARLGDEVIPFSFAGVSSGKTSQGHRIHGTHGEIDVNDPFGWLQSQSVMANRDERKAIINSQLHTAAKAEGVELVEDAELLDEVTDLVEWPQAISARYDEGFLRLPEEVSRIELKHHQRCFSAQQKDGGRSNCFFTIANIVSKEPGVVADGNVKVVNARLADAAFYFDRDPRESLESRVEKLNGVTFQDGLGTVGQQVVRLRGFVAEHAHLLNVDAEAASRAAHLCKSDLTTGLVGEFPELQGYIGGIYAEQDGESSDVSAAIQYHYQPAGADDPMPGHPIAGAIGIAERADKLLGYFHLGRIPTASADPFSLRRAAIGLIRLLTDKNASPVKMALGEILHTSAAQWREQGVTVSHETEAAVRGFIVDRLAGMGHRLAANKLTIEAALGADVDRPMTEVVDVARLLMGFVNSETGSAVAAANKRIANILKKSEQEAAATVDPGLFAEAAEKDLFAALEKAEAGFPDDPERQLEVLAGLREPVDAFFDDVMVMAEDTAVRNNRLALLSRLRGLFLKLADVSRL